jgi:hypothetical protein
MNNQTHRRQTIAIDLRNKVDSAFAHVWGLEPLAEVVQQAVHVLNPRLKPGEAVSGSGLNENWIARVALRAVAEAIVREGHLPMPLRVVFDFAGFEDGYQNTDDEAENKPVASNV